MPSESSSPRFRTVLGVAIERLAVASLVIIVCVLPWCLGGAIPLARLVLQVGSCLVLGLSLLASLIRRERLSVPSLEFWLLVALSGIGLIQLMPIYPAPTSQMKHAVFPEYSTFADSNAGPSSAAETTNNHVRSVAPSLTRFHVAQWLSAALMFCAACDLLRSKKRVVVLLSAMVINSVVMTLVALIQLFGDGQMIVGGEWMRSITTPFGTFVNPNNAAGWLLVHLAASIGLLMLVWGRIPEGMYSRSTGRTTMQDRLARVWGRALQRIASLNNGQILAALACALLIAAVAATLSRGGITAGALCLVAAILSRVTHRYSMLGFVVPILMLLFCSLTILMVFDLDTLVVSELKTLKDPVSQTTGRLLHWSDTLEVFRDFPLMGTGQGTYRFATLPYLRRWVPSWFKNADNQYLELLIESGAVGLMLFCALGLTVLSNSWRLVGFVDSAARAKPANVTLKRALGVAGITMIVAQAFAMLFDFGIGLPSVVAGFVVVAGMISKTRAMERAELERENVAMATSVVAWAIRACCLIAAVGFVPDLLNAHRIYWPIVESIKTLRPPIAREALAKLPDLRIRLTQGLVARPDDVEGLATLVDVMEAECRLDFIDSLTPDPPDDKQLNSVWAGMAPFPLTVLLENQQKTQTPQVMADLRSTLKRSLSRHDWIAESRALSARCPLIPGLRAEVIAMDFSGLGKRPKEDDIKGLLFTDPGNATRITMAGNVSFFSNDDEWARQLWKQSNRASEVFRSEILTAAWSRFPHEECLQDFAPLTYEDTVPVALKSQQSELANALWDLAEQQWQRLLPERITDRQRVVRAQELKIRRSATEALSWIDDSLLEQPENLELRRMRADLLEQTGRIQDAMGEWYRIEYLDPDNRSLESALRRLSQKQ